VGRVGLIHALFEHILIETISFTMYLCNRRGRPREKLCCDYFWRKGAKVGDQPSPKPIELRLWCRETGIFYVGVMTVKPCAQFV